MPARPMRPCTTPGCPRRAESGRCDPCRTSRRADIKRRSPWQDYGPQWPAVRADYLRRHPRCALCGQQATVPDHHPVARRQLIAQGVADPDDDAHLRALCETCHNRATATNQPGGWHRERRKP